MEQSAIMHRADKEFCYAVGKDSFLVRIHVKKNDCADITLHYTDKYLYARGKAGEYQVPMKKVASDDRFDYYEAQIQIHVICLRYFFELTDTKGEKLFLGNDLFFREKITSLIYMFDAPQQMHEEEQFVVPQWAKGKVAYQIFVDSFASEQESDKWYQIPMPHSTKLHGSLRGIINRLDYISELGVDIIYLTPIFLSESNHKYDTIDYRKIDPEFGSLEDLQELTQKAHEKNMYVILDGVFNHTSTKFFAFEDLKRNGASSAYAGWYYPESLPLDAGSRDRVPNYLSFGYFGGMPKLNCQNKEVQKYVIETVQYWMETCHIDGWRLDVGDEISHVFWKKFRAAVKAVKEDALIVGEVWYYAPGFLQGDEWDGMMNYNFKNAVLEFAAKETLPATDFVSRLEILRGNVHSEAYTALWNLIDSHDTARFLYEAAEKKGRLKVAAALQLLSPGTPMLYYGDEIAMTGGNDPDCRRGMLWKENHQDKEMFSYYQKLIQIRRTHESITKGEARYIRVSNEDKLILLERQSENDRVMIAFHAGEGVVSLPEAEGKDDFISNRKFEGTIGAYEVAIFEL